MGVIVNNIGTSDNPFIKVISKFGELDNVLVPLIVTEADKYRVPIIKWRWKQNNKPLELLIEKAVEEFQGNLKWHINKSEGGSWFLSIQKLLTDFETSSSDNFIIFRKEWSKKHQETCIQAHDELNHLAEFVAFYILSSP